MKILRVELENYRIHEKKSVEFTDGVNLLLGENGAGKSSILEALGLALFDADLRDGNKQSQAVRKGAKSAVIRVVFHGNDGLEYEVNRRIGISPHYRLSVTGEKTQRLEGRDSVLRKISKLAGIENNEKNIYQNVITAAQNKLTGAFLLSPAERQQEFDRIFNTEIYRTMYEQYSKAVLDKYAEKIRDTDRELSIRREQLVDGKELAAELKEKKAELKKTKELRKEHRTLLANMKKEKTGLEKTERDIAAKEKDAAHTKELLEKNRTDSEKTAVSLENAGQALAVVTENKTAHDRYEELNRKLVPLDKMIESLEKREKDRQTLEQEKSDLRAGIEGLESEIKSGKKQLQKSEEELGRIRRKIGEEEKQYTEILSRLDAISTEWAAAEALYTDYRERLNQEKSILEETGKLNERNRTLAGQVKETDSLPTVKETLEKALPDLKKKALRLEELRRELDKISDRKKDLQEHRSVLGKGTCPFLEEECLNLKQGTSPKNYFDGREAALEEEAQRISEEMKLLEPVAVELEKTRQELHTLNDRLDACKKTEETIRENSSSIRLLEKDLELCRAGMREIVDKEHHNSISEGKAEAVLSALGDARTGLLKEQENKDREALDAAARLREVHEEEKRRRDEQEALRTEEHSATEKLQTSKNTLSAIETKLSELEETLAPLESLKTDRLKLRDDAAELQDGHRMYSENLQESQKIGDYKNDLKTLSRNASELQCRVKGITLEKKALEEKRNLPRIEELSGLIEGEEIRGNTLAGDERALHEKTDTLEEKIQANRDLKNKCEDLEKIHTRLEGKLELAKLLRDNLRNMGKHVASRSIEKVERTATANFRRITGKSEHIRWINSESESYSVFLCRGEGLETASSFTMLSGGEQVAVALALRSALASFFTSSRFTVFDEPTINLDARRRVALAENLSTVLKELDQAIIVTHDETFREMAQNVVRL